MRTFKALSDAEFRRLFPVLTGLSDVEVNRLRGRMSERRYQAGDFLMRAGDCGQQVLFLAQGRIRVVMGDEESQSAVVAFRASGELLGEINALSEGGYSADVIAVQGCFAWSLSVDDFLECLSVMPRLSFNVARLLAMRMRQATQQLHTVVTAQTEKRIAFNLRFFFAQDAASRSNTLPACVPISMNDLASLSGCSREQLHRVLERMRKAGIIARTHGHVHVLDYEALKHFGKDDGKTSRASCGND